ncbi:hypothetical protein UQ09_20555, partial [Escherichia coli]
CDSVVSVHDFCAESAKHILSFPVFFFQQETAYSVLRRPVGSEMCIGDGINFPWQQIAYPVCRPVLDMLPPTILMARKCLKQ